MPAVIVATIGVALVCCGCAGRDSYPTGHTEEGFKELERIAKRGDPRGMYLFALAHEHENRGLNASNREAVLDWYRKAGEAGVGSASLAVARLISAESAPAADSRAAYVWTERAAKQKLSRAQVKLAIGHFVGTNYEKNVSLAYAWALMASTGGAGGESRGAEYDTATLELAWSWLDRIKSTMSPDQVEAGDRRFNELKAVIEKTPSLCDGDGQMIPVASIGKGKPLSEYPSSPKESAQQ